MRCDQARPLLSERLDSSLADDRAAGLEDHVAGCGECAGFWEDLRTLRRQLRYEALGDVPDVAPAVLAVLPQRQRRSAARLSAAAVFAAAVFAGAAFAGLGGRDSAQVRADALPQRIQQAQTEVSSLQAGVSIIERGWHAQAPERRFDGALMYSAPESLSLELVDRTAYPSSEWVPNNVRIVVAPGLRWTSAPAACPREALPECMAPEPRVGAQTGREPFPAVDPPPLDLVVPVRSFALAGPPEDLGERVIGGRAAVGAAVTAAQVQPLLEGLRQAGAWREIHPGDRVELWLDARAFVPLEVVVMPSDDPERALWAAHRGYRDPPGAAYLEIRLRDVRINEAVGEEAFSPPPADARVRDAGFAAQDPGAALPRPAWLPQGMRPHAEGIVREAGPGVAVAAWSDGRAWVKIRATSGWAGGRLFGDLGPAPRRVDLGAAGTAFVAARGTQVALHTEHIDVALSGTVGEPVLLRIAASVGLVGLDVPEGWAEGGASSLIEARAALPGLLALADSPGFSAPAARVSDGIVTLVYAGPGERGFVLTQAPGERLSPPFDGDVRGVAVRSATGRYTPALGELEWVENGIVVSLVSRTLGLGELVAIAESLDAR